MTASAANQTILVVDDEATIRDVIRRYLERDGFLVCEASDGYTALDAIEERRPDLIVLDLMLPGVDGLALTRQLRRHQRVPIIMLTARTSTQDRVTGLELGADDYLVKPFSPQELVARVKAVLRRSTESGALPGEALTFDGLRIDPAQRRVAVDGREVQLTSKEFDLLLFLARHPRQVFTRTQLLDHVWGYEFSGDPSTVTVHIRRLREKVEADASQPHYVQTVWGVGYKFEG